MVLNNIAPKEIKIIVECLDEGCFSISCEEMTSGLRMSSFDLKELKQNYINYLKQRFKMFGERLGEPNWTDINKYKLIYEYKNTNK